MQLSFSKIFYVMASLIAFFTVLVLAKGILIPIAFAVLIAFILVPVARKFEKWGANKTFAALSALLSLLLIVGGGIFLFSSQIIQLADSLVDFKAEMLDLFAEITLFINQNVGFLPQLEKGELLEQLKKLLNESAGTLLSQTFSSTANILFGLLTAIVFTFLLLIYRKGLISALVHFYPQGNRSKAFKLFRSLQQVGQQYFFGMMVIVLVLGVVNSLGLWIIGIDTPFLFGFLAAILALIPYAGTIFGAMIPILYALVSYDSLWMPVTIAIYFWLVQFVESNFLSPKIVGGNLKLNALTSILSIIIGGTVWGIAGMIVFLPFAAMLKVIFEAYEGLHPAAMLLGEHNQATTDARNDKLQKLINKIKVKLT